MKPPEFETVALGIRAGKRDPRLDRRGLRRRKTRRIEVVQTQRPHDFQDRPIGNRWRIVGHGARARPGETPAT